MCSRSFKIAKARASDDRTSLVSFHRNMRSAALSFVGLEIASTIRSGSRFDFGIPKWKRWSYPLIPVNLTFGIYRTSVVSSQAVTSSKNKLSTTGCAR